MSKYIDAEKLIERLEEMKRAEYENCGGVNSKTGALQEVQELIASLQQEQPDADLEKASRHVYESWNGGTMDDVRRDMVELGKVLNVRKEEGK